MLAYIAGIDIKDCLLTNWRQHWHQKHQKNVDFPVIISVAWGVSQRISGFGKKHQHEGLRRQIIRSKLLSSSVLWPARAIMPGVHRHYNLLLFLVQRSQLFSALMSGYSITGAQAYWAVERACLPRSSHFSTASRYLQNKIPNLHWGLGGLDSMSDMWWTGGFNAMSSTFFFGNFELWILKMLFRNTRLIINDAKQAARCSENISGKEKTPLKII